MQSKKPLLAALLTIALNGCVNINYIPNNKGCIQIKLDEKPSILNGNELEANLSMQELKPPISASHDSH